MLSTSLSKPVKSICVVGAGAAGLIALHEFRQSGFSVTALEMLGHVGGIWKSMNSNAIYDSLVTNLPKEVMAISEEFPFRESLPSFVHHSDVNEYLHNFAEQNQLLDSIKLNCNVICTKKEYHKGSDKEMWRVDYVDTTRHEEKSLYCDALVVCNGHFNEPVCPEIKGIEHFRGELMHSKSYKNPSGFADKTVVVVGAKSSATDIAREIASVARSLHVSNRSYSGPSFTSNVTGIHHHGGLEGMNETGVLKFLDGEEVVADCIVHCTGYEYHFPFLPTDSSPCVSVCSRSVRPLYRHVFHEDDPTLSFIGLPHTIIPFPIFLAQARWVAAVYSGAPGSCPLASTQEMREWREEYESLLRHPDRLGGPFPSNYHYMGGYMWEYLRDLARLTHRDADENVPLQRNIRLLQEIYTDVGTRRPREVGASDAYRRNQYTVDRETGKWTVHVPEC